MTRSWRNSTDNWSLERDLPLTSLNLSLKFGTWLAVERSQLIIEIWNMTRGWRNSTYNWTLEREFQLTYLNL